MGFEQESRKFKKENSVSVFDENETENFFGYDIFLKDPSLFQMSSFGATVDPDYLIGPGDRG